MEYGISESIEIVSSEMFREREIILAFVKDINPPKEKFFITLHRGEDLNVVACLTTSQHRVIPPEEVRHGVVRKDNEPVAYVFEKDRQIGIDPENHEPFSFNKRTMVVFDYCMQEGSLDNFIKRTEQRRVVCELNDNDFEELLYAMFQSSKLDKKYIPIIEKALRQHFDKSDREA